MSVRDFYDGLAADYHLVYEDWHAEVARQGEALDRLIRAALPGAVEVLDCSCGIGTQALGLARLGYRVKGTDISERSLEGARSEAARLGLDIPFAFCDFRDLTPVKGEFDAVISPRAQPDGLLLTTPRAIAPWGETRSAEQRSSPGSLR